MKKLLFIFVVVFSLVLIACSNETTSLNMTTTTIDSPSTTTTIENITTELEFQEPIIFREYLWEGIETLPIDSEINEKICNAYYEYVLEHDNKFASICSRDKVRFIAYLGCYNDEYFFLPRMTYMPIYSSFYGFGYVIMSFKNDEIFEYYYEVNNIKRQMSTWYSNYINEVKTLTMISLNDIYKYYNIQKVDTFFTKNLPINELVSNKIKNDFVTITNERNKDNPYFTFQNMTTEDVGFNHYFGFYPNQFTGAIVCQPGYYSDSSSWVIFYNFEGICFNIATTLGSSLQVYYQGNFYSFEEAYAYGILTRENFFQITVNRALAYATVEYLNEIFPRKRLIKV